MINIKDLYKTYSNHLVLKGLNLEVKRGEILVILGRSGVGKSVLLKHIIGIEKPDSGKVEIDGVDITNLSFTDLYKHIKNMGMLFQGSALFDSMNIEQNTGFYLEYNLDPISKKKLNKKEIKEKVCAALQMVGLEDAKEKMPSDLSGGMKKRAALARLIAYRPKILLYDEPTTGLDPITSNQINELIVKTQNELGGTSIIVTHDIHSAWYVADRIAMHRDGKIIYIDTPEEFIKIDDPDIAYLKKTLTNFERGR
ncbi:MAG: putative ribonucleotide transport ATP-binding protein mkl [Candidatus Anoxychlamydiales bacterium]|nr:putative ribonucleotide transport ATP-binding protein mkl [Candidatus Anoxychlamydiales bacterium]NGX51721.1 putative ribonucleotide transport ATP-binding protein mkl [Candidatus Anoxychlamydiales bacterium]